MKKFWSLVLLLTLFIPSMVSAKVDDPDYKVKAMYVSASILDNGSMNVKELIVLKGDFNGYERELLVNNKRLNETSDFNFEQNTIYNPSSIDILNVSAKDIDDLSFDEVDGKFSDFKKVNYDAIGSSGSYYQKDLGNKTTIRTYNSCYDCQVGFYYEYQVNDVVVMHNDVAELYYTFIGDAFLEDIKNVEIRVNLPKKDDSSLFRLWAHGNLIGEINKNDDSTGVIATVSPLKNREALDIRLTFTPSLITNTKNLAKTGIDALDEILKVEEKRADERNEEIARNKRNLAIVRSISAIYVIILIIIAIRIYIKYDKEYDGDFDHQYNREFIDDYNVEVIDYLMNRNITSNAMSASIMNMIYKKNITLEKDEKNKYTFTLANKDNLDACENYLVTFLFERVGSGNTFTLDDLKKYAKGTKTYSNFTSSYENWKNKVVARAKQENFYENNTGIKTLGALFAILGIILSVINICLIDGFDLSKLVIIPAIIFLIYVLSFTKKTIKGANHYKRWKAFKNFLNDFGSFESKELPEVILWERYLVYAVIFGLASKVQKDMNVKIKEIEALPNTTSTISFSDIYLSHIISNNISSAINSAVSSAISASLAQAAKASGSGSGGGFSSGGGFGGGGGGGHGF